MTWRCQQALNAAWVNKEQTAAFCTAQVVTDASIAAPLCLSGMWYCRDLGHWFRLAMPNRLR